MRATVRVIKNVLLVLLAGTGLLLLWGLIEPYFIDWQEQRVEIPGLPESWEGQRVALIADLQVGMWVDNTWTIRRIVDGLVEEKPALVLIAGDFVYHPGEDPSSVIREVTRLLQPLTEAGIPTYAVLGNHDYEMPTKNAARNEALAAAVRSSLEAVGIEVLKNEAVPLASPRMDDRQDPLYLVGIGAHIPGEDRPELALAGVPDGAPRLVMMHHPNSFAALPEGSAPLAVAGHTHGGQFRLPFMPEWSWMTFASEDEVHADGWISAYGRAGNQLYVNRGIGFSVLPLRLNCPPEVTLFTLHREEDSNL